MGRLLALFVIVPILEMVVLVEVGRRVGTLPTIVMVVALGLLGASLARSQGLGVLRKISRELSAGEIPGASLLDGLLILVAGALLVTPGLITDAAGLLLLVPAVRARVRRWARRWIERRMLSGAFFIRTRR